MENGVGFQILDADGPVSASGKAVVIYGYSIYSGAGAAVNFYNGTDTSGDLVIQHTTASGTNEYTSLGGVGVTFPGGCYIDLDVTNGDIVRVYYRRIK